MEIITYGEARKAGRLRYFTGKPCLAGHIAERYSRTGTCVQCHVERANRYLIDNSERRKETGRNYYKNNLSEITKRLIAYRENNRELCNARSREWSKLNKPKLAETRAKRRILQKTATPTWANRNVIRIEYELAAWCSKVMGEKYHVDHIIPINHKFVCGLHVPANLQVIPASANIKKSNKFVID